VPSTDLKRRSEILGAILSYLVSITTILGIPVALYGYFVSQQQSRVDRTFEFYKDFRAADLQDDVNLLVDNFSAKADEIKKVLATSDQAGLDKLEESLVQDPKASAALTHVVIFYDGIGPCIDHLLCDGDAAVALLQDPAYQIVRTYGAYLNSLHKDSSPFAKGIFTVGQLNPTTSKFWSLFPWLSRSSN
jgi:hypothetical protein